MENDLDCRGLQCPEPVVRCRALLKKENPEKVRVIVDNAAALENVSRFLGTNGFTVSSSHPANNEWIIEGKKTETAAAKEETADGDIVKTLVFITSETLGTGNDELGRKLMETFLATLPELGESLWRIVLVNGGVKLTATQGPCLEHLKKLADSGTGILVCGTCMMHYGLMEQKQVGDTTNMMDIMTSFALAQKIIRP